MIEVITQIKESGNEIDYLVNVFGDLDGQNVPTKVEIDLANKLVDEIGKKLGEYFGNKNNTLTTVKYDSPVKRGILPHSM